MHCTHSVHKFTPEFGLTLSQTADLWRFCSKQHKCLSSKASCPLSECYSLNFLTQTLGICASDLWGMKDHVWVLLWVIMLSLRLWKHAGLSVTLQLYCVRLSQPVRHRPSDMSRKGLTDLVLEKILHIHPLCSIDLFLSQTLQHPTLWAFKNNLNLWPKSQDEMTST